MGGTVLVSGREEGVFSKFHFIHNVAPESQELSKSQETGEYRVCFAKRQGAKQFAARKHCIRLGSCRTLTEGIVFSFLLFLYNRVQSLGL